MFENCYRLTFSPSDSYAEDLISIATVFGDRAFKEVMKVTWSHKGGGLIQ